MRIEMTRPPLVAALAFGAIVLAAVESLAEELSFSERARAFD